MGRGNEVVADVRAMLRLMQPLEGATGDPIQRKRRLVADLCRLVGSEYGKNTAGVGLSPRLQQTLGLLLTGDSEKQIAAGMGVSRHTVHVYVKQLYRHYASPAAGS